MPLIRKHAYLNDLTHKLFDLLDTDVENVEAIQALLEATLNLEKCPESKSCAIKFTAVVDIQGKKYKTLRRNVTCLDVAILKNKLAAMTLLIEHIFINSKMSLAEQQTIFSSAIFICILNKKMAILKNILNSQLLDVNQPIKYAINLQTNLPLCLAVLTHQTEAISLLLSSGADPHKMDKEKKSAWYYAKRLNPPCKIKTHLVQLLSCPTQINLARDAYRENNAPKIYKLLAEVIEIDTDLFSVYLKRCAHRAIQQLSNPEDKTDYRFIKEFIRVYTAILTSPLSSLAYRQRFELFQMETIQHLIGAYDIDAVISHAPKLFNTKKEKYEFFNTFGLVGPLAGSECEKTLKKMQENELLTPCHNESTTTGQTFLLVKSLQQAGLLTSTPSLTTPKQTNSINKMMPQ